MTENNGKETTVSPGIIQGKRLPFLIAFSIPVLLYFQTVKFEFTHFDDTQLISDNYEFLSDFKNASKTFTTGAFVSKANTFYRPLQTLSYMVDIKISGGNKPRMYHLTNVLLLGLISCILFLFLKRLSIPPKLALLSSLIFCIHPLFVSTAAWIPARGDMLLYLFSILSFLYLIMYLQEKKRKYLLFHWITFTISLFCKETAAFLPFLFIAYYLIFSFKKSIDKPFLLIILLYGVSGIVWFSLRNKAVGDYEIVNGIFGMEALKLNLGYFTESLSKFLLPFKIAPIPGYSVFKTLTGLAVIAGIIAVIISKNTARPKKELVFWLLWYLILLLPSMILKHDRMDYLDHRFFLPLTGILIFLLFAIPAKWYSEGDIRRPWILVTAMIVLGIYSFTKTKAYADPMTYYDAAVKQNNNSALAYNNRGFMKSRNGDPSGAIADYNRAIEISPDYYISFSDRGWVKSTTGDIKGAMDDLNKAITLNENHDVSYYRRGVVYLKTGNIENALNDFNRLLKIDPENAQGYNYRGLAYFQAGNLQEAMNNFNRAIQLDPRYSEAYGYRAIAKYLSKDLRGALKDCDKAIRLNPKDKKILNIRTKIMHELKAAGN